MKLFTVKLTDDERASLEAIRKARGLRSQAETVRELIADAAPEPPIDMEAWGRSLQATSRAILDLTPQIYDVDKAAKTAQRVAAKAVKVADDAHKVAVQLGPTPSPVGSRLKGEKGKKP